MAQLSASANDCSLDISSSQSSGSRRKCDQSFDYGCVSSDVAQFLRGQADRIHKTSARSIINIGRDLVAAKHFLSHGMFLRWATSEVGISPRTAQAYMQLAQWATSKGERISRLPPSILYVLSAPSTPQEFVDEVMKRVEDGERVVASALRSELRARVSRRRLLPAEAEPSTSRLIAERPDPKSCSASFAEAVAILAQQLPELEFERIRAIMTNPQVLSDPNLSHTITLSFVRLRPETALPDDTEYFGH